MRAAVSSSGSVVSRQGRDRREIVAFFSRCCRPRLQSARSKAQPHAGDCRSLGLHFLPVRIIFAQATFNLTFLQPDTSEETIIFAAVSALIFLLFVALTFVLLRTLLRLYAERKAGALGSKFRSHMVLGALLLSLGPVIFLFLFSYGLMNRSVEKWFSRPVEDVQYRTNVIVSLLTQYAATNADAEAQRHRRHTGSSEVFPNWQFQLHHRRVPPQ